MWVMEGGGWLQARRPIGGEVCGRGRRAAEGEEACGGGERPGAKVAASGQGGLPKAMQSHQIVIFY